MPPQIFYNYFNILKVKYFKILNHFDILIYFFLLSKWFWLSAVPNISNSRFAKVLKCKFYVFDVQLILEECRSKHFMFPLFCIFCAGSTLNTFEYLHACTSQNMCWNFAQNI